MILKDSQKFFMKKCIHIIFMDFNISGYSQDFLSFTVLLNYLLPIIPTRLSSKNSHELKLKKSLRIKLILENKGSLI